MKNIFELYSVRNVLKDNQEAYQNGNATEPYEYYEFYQIRVYNYGDQIEEYELDDIKDKTIEEITEGLNSRFESEDPVWDDFDCIPDEGFIEDELDSINVNIQTGDKFSEEDWEKYEATNSERSYDVSDSEYDYEGIYFATLEDAKKALQETLELKKSNAERKSSTNNSTDSNVVRDYHENGNVKAEYQVNEHNQRHGYVKLFHENGELQVTASYTNGKQDDAEILSYHDNGVKARLVKLQDGEFNGEFFEWHKNGNLKTNGYYLKHNYHWKLRKYDENGTLVEVLNYDNGELVKNNVFANLKGVFDFINRSKKETRSLIINLLKIAMADGEVSNDELMLIYNVAKYLNFNHTEVDEILINIDKSKDKLTIPKDINDRINYLGFCVDVMIADGEIDSNEMKICKQIALKYELSDNVVEGLLEKRIVGYSKNN